MTTQNLQILNEFRGIKVTYNDFTFAISDKIFYAVLIMVLLLLFFSKIGREISKADPTNPSDKFSVLIGLLIYQNIRKFIGGVIKKADLDQYLPILGSLFIYLLVVNWSGLLGLGEAIGTTSTSLTFAYSFGIGIFTIIVSIKKNGVVNYLGGFLKPFPFFLPLNLMELVTKPLSMGIRIFANLTSGIIIAIVLKYLIVNGVGNAAQKLVLSITQIVSIGANSNFGMIANQGASLITNIALTPFLNAYFDIFAGFIQALIFTMLSAVSIAEAIE